MSELAFVVVSTPRSATRFLASVLTRAGILCGHESCFNPWQAAAQTANLDQRGDASWMAAPFLDSLPPRTAILHVVREPVLAMNSIIHTEHFHPRNPGNRPYSEFLFRHFPAGRLQSEQALAIRFWHDWHCMILKKSASRRYCRVRVEDIDAARLAEITAWLGHPRDPREIAAALAATSTAINHRGRPAAKVRWSGLPRYALQLAAEFGYRPA